MLGSCFTLGFVIKVVVNICLKCKVIPVLGIVKKGLEQVNLSML